METLFKFALLVCIIVGGLTLMGYWFPKQLASTLFHIGQYSITGGLVLIAVLFYVGIKAIK